MATFLQLFVQVIQKDISQKRRKWAALRNPLTGFLQAPTDLDSGTQLLADQAKHTLIPDLPGYSVHEHVVVNSVEKL